MTAAALLALQVMARSADPSVPAAGLVAEGAVRAGHRDLAAEVVRYCRVESGGCRRIGAHLGHDNAPGRLFWDRAVRVGWLDPATCPAHARGDAAATGWGPTGPLGLVAAYQARHLGPCASPAAVADPLVAGWLAARRLSALRRAGYCDEAARRVAYRDGEQSDAAFNERRRCGIKH